MESQQRENKALEEKQKKSEIIVNNTILPSQLTIAAAAVNDTKVPKQKDDETKAKVPTTNHINLNNNTNSNNSKVKRKRKTKKVRIFYRL